MTATLVLTAMACVAACGSKPNPSLTLSGRNHVELDRIADKCSLPWKTFQLVGSGDVQMQPASDADYKIDCAIAEFKGKSALKLGFVGNEYYDGNEQ